MSTFRYFHDVNAKVEEGRRYLTDNLKLALDTNTGVHRVTLYPVVADGEQTITTTPVHPKTVGETKVVPTFIVPTTLKILVRADVNTIEHETAGENQRNWVEATVPVSPIVDESFTNEAEAIAYYAEVEHQLSQGDVVRNYNRANVVRDGYSFYNNRYPHF